VGVEVVGGQDTDYTVVGIDSYYRFALAVVVFVAVVDCSSNHIVVFVAVVVVVVLGTIEIVVYFVDFDLCVVFQVIDQSLL